MEWEHPTAPPNPAHAPCQGQHGTGKAQELTFHRESQQAWDLELLVCQQRNPGAGWELAGLGGCHPAQLSLAKALGSTSTAGSGFSSSVRICLVYWDLGLKCRVLLL